MDRWKGVCNVNKCNMLQPCKFDQYSLETGETDIQNVARNVFNKVLVLHFWIMAAVFHQWRKSWAAKVKSRNNF